jgi:acyl carrier protein
MPPTFEEVLEKIASVLKTDPRRLNRNTTAADVTGWDSVTHANLILTLEDTYGMQFSDDEILDMSNVGMLYDRLATHLKREA